jgi:hypothetical protein
VTCPKRARRLPWGYFGNESSEVDFYTFAALHIAIPKVGAGPRAATKTPKRIATKTPKRIASKRRRPPEKG